eukprot:761049-Hanusia_phi.AAC.4
MEQSSGSLVDAIEAIFTGHAEHALTEADIDKVLNDLPEEEEPSGSRAYERSASTGQGKASPEARRAEKDPTPSESDSSGPAHDERSGRRQNRWRKEEHEAFLQGVKKYCHSMPRFDEDGVFVGLGDGVADIIAAEIGSRTAAQVRSHAQKYFLSKQYKRSSEATSGGP